MLKREKLFEKFPPVTREKWMEKIIADLKGADFSKKLVWKTREGLEVMPFYRQDDLDRIHHRQVVPGDFPYVRGSRVNHNTWLIRQDLPVKDYQGANRKALDILMKGVTSLGFVIEDAETINVENITTLLKGIHCESVELNFSSPGKALELIAALESFMWASETDLSKVRISIAADPLGRLAANGKLCIPVEQGLDYLAELVTESAAVTGMRCIEPAGTLFSNAGAGVVTELAFTLALGNEYLASMVSKKLNPDIVANQMRFTFGIGSDFFPEIAKLRAARLLWALIVKGHGTRLADSAEMIIHSVTGRWNKTLYDPYVNMLRTQTETMSAVLGGADSITVEPFDTVFRNPDEFSERIARNQQLLLMEESHLDKVADPAAGSYYIEKLTEMIARQAWTLFLETENQGGFLEALKKGWIQKKIREADEARKNDLARRREILLGTNQYPNFKEKASPEADLSRILTSAVAQEEVEPIAPSRGSADFEALRLATEQSGRKPLAFMLTIGNLAMRRARAQFSSNFFACAGYLIKDNDGFATAEEGVRAALEAKADIIVICSSDDDYELVAHDVFTLTAGRAIVVVAGNPPCMDKLKAEGVEYFISIRSDVLDTLLIFNKKLGIPEVG